MAQPTRLITTVGGAYSNSYVTVSEADLIAVNFPWYAENGSTGWKDFDEDAKRQALVQAAFAMQGLPYAGTKCEPASDANTPAKDWKQYWITVKADRNSDGIFDYFYEEFDRGVGQGDAVFKWGTPGTALLKDVTTYQAKTFETALTFWDKDDNKLTPDDTELISSSGSSGDETRETLYIWDSPVQISYITGEFNDAFDPFATGTWYWGVYVNGDQLLNFPGTSEKQVQRLSWPRSGVSCEGEVADCSFIPETIKLAQVLIAYNFLIYPNLVPGTPSAPPSAPKGTFISEQTLGSLTVKYDQYDGFDPNADNCTNCGDPYLYRTFDWLKNLLGCWVVASSGAYGLRLRVRS